MTKAKKKFDVAEYGWGYELMGIMKDAHPVSTDWAREGITGDFHPLGAGRRYIQGRAYSNGIYRQLVERDDGMWDDCIMERQQGGIIILTQRIVAPAKAAHVADHYGVVLKDVNGVPIPFEPDRAEPESLPPMPEKPAREKIGKTYNLKQFIEEQPEGQSEIMAELVAFLSEWYTNWQLGETSSMGMAYPFFYHASVDYWPCVLRTDGDIEIPFQWVSKREPFASQSGLVDLFAEQLRKVFGTRVIFLTKGRPHFPCSVLSDPSKMRRFKDIMVWFEQVVLNNGKTPAPADIDPRYMERLMNNMEAETENIIRQVEKGSPDA